MDLIITTYIINFLFIFLYEFYKKHLFFDF